jgi:predicted membrane protein
VKTPTTHIRNFKSLLLFREDLQELVGLFKSSEANWNVLISDGQRPYGSFDEMRSEKGDEVRLLTLANDDIGIKFEVSKWPRLMRLSTLNATSEAELAFYNIKEFLETKTRPLYIWITRYLVWPVWTILILLLSFGSQHQGEPVHGFWGWSGLILFLMTVCYMIFLGVASETISYSVTIKRHHEVQPFLQRKKDDLILMFIGALIGIAATVIIQKLIK